MTSGTTSQHHAATITAAARSSSTPVQLAQPAAGREPLATRPLGGWLQDVPEEDRCHSHGDQQDWGRAFLDGRVLWGGEARSYYEIVVKKLLGDSKSVWTRVRWEEATGAW